MISLAMPRLLLCVVAALALPAVAVSASAPSPPPQLDARVVAFYYPWYGTPAIDGIYQHWSQDGHTPPDDIASSYYPARGLYSSSDKLVLAAQMDEIRGAGIGEIAVSWWGQGTPEDQRLPAVIAAAHADGIQVAVHLEPYAGRTVASTVADVAYLRDARDQDVLRLPGARPTDRRLGRGHAAASPGRHGADGTDRARRRRGGGRVRRRLHVRHPHVHRRQVRAALQRGACDASALRAVGRAGLPRAPRRRRSAASSRAGTAAPTTACGRRRSTRAPTS